jgi:hypothetical protein
MLYWGIYEVTHYEQIYGDYMANDANVMRCTNDLT